VKKAAILLIFLIGILSGSSCHSFPSVEQARYKIDTSNGRDTTGYYTNSYILEGSFAIVEGAYGMVSDGWNLFHFIPKFYPELKVIDNIVRIIDRSQVVIPK